ncbi:hypothetical protein Tco_0903146 [Tanacetum coccineum]
MTTLAEHIIVAGAENRPPMLEKSMIVQLFDSNLFNNQISEDSVHRNGAIFSLKVEVRQRFEYHNYDQLYAYLSQHEQHAQEVRVMHERYPDPLALVWCDDNGVLLSNNASMMIWGLAAMVKSIDCMLFGNDDKHMMSCHSVVFDKPRDFISKVEIAHVYMLRGLQKLMMLLFIHLVDTTRLYLHVNHDGSGHGYSLSLLAPAFHWGIMGIMSLIVADNGTIHEDVGVGHS